MKIPPTILVISSQNMIWIYLLIYTLDNFLTILIIPKSQIATLINERWLMVKLKENFFQLNMCKPEIDTIVLDQVEPPRDI